MPQGSHLSQDEQSRILAYKDCGKSNRQIATLLARSLCVVNRFVKNPAGYGPKHRSGRPRKISQRNDRAIQRAASNKITSLMKINADLNLGVTKTTIWNSLKRSGHVVRRKMKIAPRLLPRHRAARLAFAQAQLAQRTDWNQVVWSDEKKWNLDGPDGDRGYWHDLRKEPLSFGKRGFGGGSLMVWAAFCADSTVALAFVTSRMNSNDYQTVLHAHLVPFLNSANQPYRLMADNAPIHNSNSTKQWLQNNNVSTLVWPALSPDLNPLENLFGILARSVYAYGKQYDNVNSLKAAIIREWQNLDVRTFKNLVDSVPNRLLQVVQRSGGATDY